MFGTVYKADGTRFEVEPHSVINLCRGVLPQGVEQWAFDADKRRRYVVIHAPFCSEPANPQASFVAGMLIHGNAIIFGYEDMIENGYIMPPGEWEEGV
jgi:hypothetical protein